MQIQNLPTTQNRLDKTSFKSVYPVYHWCKTAGGSYAPTFNIKEVKHFQRLLTNILNSGNKETSKKDKKQFAQVLIKHIKEMDPDYKANPCVRTFINYKGGVKTAWNGNTYDIEPSAYLLTGKDAIEFDLMYSRPISVAKHNAKQLDNPKIMENEINNAKKSYGLGGATYVKRKVGLFKDKITQKPLELHTIIDNTLSLRKTKFIKLKFFETESENNPLKKNGII